MTHTVLFFLSFFHSPGIYSKYSIRSSDVIKEERDCTLLETLIEKHSTRSTHVRSSHLTFLSFRLALFVCVGIFSSGCLALQIIRCRCLHARTDLLLPVDSCLHRASNSVPLKLFLHAHRRKIHTHCSQPLCLDDTQDPRANAPIFQVIARRCHVTSHVKSRRKPSRCCCCGLFFHRAGKVTLVESTMQ